jgi:hypothetical protein
VFAVTSVLPAVYLGIQQWIAALILLGFFCVAGPIPKRPLSLIRRLLKEGRSDEQR